MIKFDADKQLETLSISAKFEFQSQGVVALFGRSGAGKTSIINMFAGLIDPDRGHIQINGRTLFNSETGINIKTEQRRIGYVFQEARLFPHMTVRANLVYGRTHSPSDNSPIDFDQAVQTLGLDHLLNRKPITLSGGERQRVALGRALLANPDILLMDEPLASLDAPRKAEILHFIEVVRDTFNIPIIYVSHAIDEIIRLADTLVLLDDGVVTAVGSVEELTSRVDLWHLTGRNDAGSVIPALIKSHDTSYALTTLSFAGGLLRVPLIDADLGQSVRVKIRARDISLALQKPTGISQINILSGKIQDIEASRGRDDEITPHEINICVDIGVPLWVRITKLSLDQLKLSVGKEVYALIKSTSIDRQSLGKKAPKAI